MPAALPFKEAVANLKQKGLLPTNLSSADLAQLDAALKRQSMFSARTTIKGYLAEIKDTVTSILNPVQVLREGAEQTVTEGFNPATARVALRDALKKSGYTPGEDVAGTIKDLSSDARLNLVIKTNTELAQGAGAFIKQNDPDVVQQYPAAELVRFEDRKTPRDWDTRWKLCAQVVGDVGAATMLADEGRMIALKSSAIWQALGDGEDGSTDTLGNPFPPFAFGSGMWTQDVSYQECVDLGLLEDGAEVQPAKLDLATLFEEAA